MMSRYETFPDGKGGVERAGEGGLCHHLRLLLLKLCPCWPLDLLPLKR